MAGSALLEVVDVWIDRGDGFLAGVAIRDAMLYSSSNCCCDEELLLFVLETWLKFALLSTLD